MECDTEKFPLGVAYLFNLCYRVEGDLEKVRKV
jgi:hypothetical protein